ncbi:hypothetical protein J4467_02630 [Candidatus Woesearchaeota archaeon]|nr:hypothetical protein [Candidatus Woesearchaeota archaeon]
MARKKAKLERIDLNKRPDFYNTYIQATILAGATSVPLLMGITYLGQFRDLNGEFATHPIFPPDFLIGRVPYSNRLLTAFNDVSERLGLNPGLNGEGLKVAKYPNTQPTIDDFLENGAQLSRLYTTNIKLLRRFPETEEQGRKKLFAEVERCYFRDKRLAESLRYLTRP